MNAVLQRSVAGSLSPSLSIVIFLDTATIRADVTRLFDLVLNIELNIHSIDLAMSHRAAL